MEDGFYPVAVGCKPNGERLPVSLAYLTEEVRRRPNLAILTSTLVARLLLEGTKAIGVELEDGRKLLARETIVSFGGIHSPAFLMRSGIGPASQLQEQGIDVVADRRGVGRNLREHPSLAVSAFIPPGLRLHEDGVHQSQTCIKMSSGLPGTGVGDLFFQTLAKSAWHAMGRRLGTMFFWINKSYSTGSLVLSSADFRDEPQVDFNFLSDPRDLQRMMQCVRFAGGILKTLHARGAIGVPFPTVFSERVKKVSAVTRSNALQLSAFGTLLDMVGTAPREALLRLFVTEGPQLDDLLRDEAALEAFVLKSVGGTWHPSGTCRMGAVDDPDAVTDSSGRVIGVSGLRVCDASLMPTIPRANTNVPVIMIAERIADLIKQEERAVAA